MVIIIGFKNVFMSRMGVKGKFNQQHVIHSLNIIIYLFYFQAIFSIISTALVLANPVEITQPYAITPASPTDAQVAYLINQYHGSTPLQFGSHAGGNIHLPDPENGKTKDNISTDDHSFQYEGKTTTAALQGYPKGSDGYDFYFPQAEDYADNSKLGLKDLQLMEMQPPQLRTDEPNYYAIKPKKGTKKFQSNQKHVNYKKDKSNQKQKSLMADDEQYYTFGEKQAATINQYRTVEDEFNTGEYMPEEEQQQQQRKAEVTESDDAASNGGGGERVEYQMHGFNGPNSYKFGYDTGKG